MSPAVPASTDSNVRLPPPPSGHQLDVMERIGIKAEMGPKRSLKVAIITENFLPKVDGVTRTLARLLEHLQLEGHQAMVLGPTSGMTSYAGHEVVETVGIPLLGVYKGLGLNFIRPKFIRKLLEFQPDVIQFVDPIWLCAQCIPAVQYFLPDTPLLTSYHTNLSTYATLFGFSWLTPVMWSLQRRLHGSCRLTFCPSPSTARMLTGQGFNNVRLWPRGVDTGLFRPEARDLDLRRSWGAEPEIASTPRVSRESSRRSSLDEVAAALLEQGVPPPYSAISTSNSRPLSAQSKIVCLYVGRISWEKNLRLLVEAFRGLQHPSPDGSCPACQLVFVGDGPSRPELETLCASYGLDAIFMGYRRGAELAACFASADIFAFPSWTETFGQVVLESLASGLPVCGLRAEGVCDLVEDGKTGLLLDLDDLLPATSSAGCPSKPLVDPLTGFSPLPENPHELVGLNSPTFPLAVSMYRSMIVEMATNHDRRIEMGRLAAKDAARRSWHGAMEMIVDGYREIARPESSTKSSIGLSLSRTPTIEVDVVSHSAEADTYAESSSSSSRSKRLGVKRVLRLGGALRRTGGRLRESSISAPLRTWLSGPVAEPIESFVQTGALETVESTKMITSSARWFIKLSMVFFGIYLLSQWALTTDILSSQLHLRNSHLVQ